MGGPAAILIILASAGFPAVLAGLARRRMRVDVLRQHHDVGSTAFLQLGVLYAVLLAFVFNQVWQEYNIAQQAIAIESSGLHGAAILAQTLPEPSRGDIGRAVAAYVRAVTEDEWPAMARRRASKAATDAFQTLWQVTAQVETEGRNTGTRAQMLSLLATAHEQREIRLYQMGHGVPTPLWVLLVLLSVVLVVLVALAGIDSVASVMTFTGLFAAALASILVLVRLLDFPFEGALALSPARFAETLQSLQLLFGA
jgi:amino acid transporter